MSFQNILIQERNYFLNLPVLNFILNFNLPILKFYTISTSLYSNGNGSRDFQIESLRITTPWKWIVEMDRYRAVQYNSGLDERYPAIQCIKPQLLLLIKLNLNTMHNT